MIYLGIDPGKSGAIAAIIDGGEREWIKLTETPADIADWIQVHAMVPNNPQMSVAMIERVSASPQMGVTSAFSFGRSYGWLLGLLDGFKIPYDFVTPQKWQQHMGCLTKGVKNVSKSAAQRLWPWMKITHANADALLIAEYCRRMHK